MVMKISNYFNAISLHINDRYATSFLSKRAYPLFGAALQPTFKYVGIALEQDLVPLLRWHTLHKIITCKLDTVILNNK